MMGALSWPRRIVAVLIGGFCGTVARYLFSLLIQQHLGNSWPYDILLVNISGALLFALVTTLADGAFMIGPTRRLFINVGFLGAYTTFSSLALGDILLLTKGVWLPAMLYLFVSVIGGLLVGLLGEWLGMQLLRLRRGTRRIQQNGIAEATLRASAEDPTDQEISLTAVATIRMPATESTQRSLAKAPRKYILAKNLQKIPLE